MSLVTVQKITKVMKHPNADALDIVNILGWQCVAKLGEFREGQLVSYIPIDTVCPPKPEFAFLEKYSYRVKTQKLRGELSQGLVLPLPVGTYKEGDDITDVLGVKKYEKADNNPISLYEKPRMPKSGWAKWKYIIKYNYLYKWFPSLQKKSRSPFPTHLVGITDEVRIQNVPQVMNTYRGKLFDVRYKLDGSSITIIHNKSLGKSKYRICSRRFELHDKNNDWYRVFASTNFSIYIDALVKYYKTNDIIVQAEAIGKFNGNHHNLTQDRIAVFNIIVSGKRLLPEEFEEVSNILNIPVCPRFVIRELTGTLQDIIKFSEVSDILNPKVPSEGFVWRELDTGYSFKVINNQYLLKEK